MAEATQALQLAQDPSFFSSARLRDAMRVRFSCRRVKRAWALKKMPFSKTKKSLRRPSGPLTCNSASPNEALSFFVFGFAVSDEHLGSSEEWGLLRPGVRS